MKLILAVLTIRMIMELVTKKKKEKKMVQNTGTGKVQHPAAYELR